MGRLTRQTQPDLSEEIQPDFDQYVSRAWIEIMSWHKNQASHNWFFYMKIEKIRFSLKIEHKN